MLKVENLSNYKYQHEFIRDPYTSFSYTIFFKIKMDEGKFNELKSTYFINCNQVYNHQVDYLESIYIKLDNYQNYSANDIPEWFKTHDFRVDVYMHYDIAKESFVDCSEDHDAWVSMRFLEGYCYIIFESSNIPRKN
jgi:hypothetical protein